MLESAKDTTFVARPSASSTTARRKADRRHHTRGLPELDLYASSMLLRTYHEIRKRGIRVVIGGDYGFSVTPMGQNASDIEHFVRYFGYAPAEALRCATAVAPSSWAWATSSAGSRKASSPTSSWSRATARGRLARPGPENLAMIMAGGKALQGPARPSLGDRHLIAQSSARRPLARARECHYSVLRRARATGPTRFTTCVSSREAQEPERSSSGAACLDTVLAGRRRMSPIALAGRQPPTR